MLSKRLSSHYVRYHRAERRYGFSYVGIERAALFSQLIGSGKLVFDLGSRDGTLSAAFLAGNRVVGVDIDPVALRLAASRLQGFETVLADLNITIPFKSKVFDVVVAGEVVEHIIFVDEFLMEVQRVIKPGGLFLGSTPNLLHLKNRLRFLLGKLPDTLRDETHLHYFSYQSLERMLSKGFRNVRIVAVGTKPWLKRMTSHIPSLATDLCWVCQAEERT